MNLELAATSVLDLTADLLVIGVQAEATAPIAALDARLGGGVAAHLTDRGFKAGAGEAILLPTFGRVAAPQIAVLGLGSGSDDDVRKAAGKLGWLAREQKAARVGADLGTLSAAQLTLVYEQVSVGNYAWERYLPADRKRAALATLTLAGTGLKADTKADTVRARWQTLARDLVNLPAAELYPASFAAQAKEALAGIQHVTVEVIDFEACKAKGLVGIVAVGQGSAEPGCLVHVRYAPPAPKQTIALVGKGVTFDSGGLSLKPSDAMQTMRCDMGGAATALATIGAIAESGLPLHVEAFIPCVENMVSGTSYKLGDILTYKNGVTVEIHNTDAEGRLVLADALILASEVPNVSRIVDMATLTGAIIIGIGSDFTGVFTPHDGLAAEISAAGAANGELFWRLPLHAGYKRLLKGTWSGMKNVGGREAGSITAALFLQAFVKSDIPWAHLDIAGTAFADSAHEPYAAGGTGQVVRTLVSWAKSLAD